MKINNPLEINDFIDLKNECWSGALNVLEKVEEKGRESELMDLLEELNSCSPFEDMTQLNDFIWFDLENWEGWENLYKEENEEEIEL